MNDADDDIPSATRSEPGEVGLVEPRDFITTEPFTFDNGQTTPGFTLRYETYGRPNAARDNAILIFHALSGDHHCAGIHSLNDRKPGWWNNLIGPGKAVDTNKFFVLCSNVIGGCQGSSGPSSIDPRTGKPYGITFPSVTIRDMVRTQKLWLDSIGITSIYAAIGGSMGGMQVLQWSIEYPSFVKRALAMATTAREGAQAIAFNEVGRQAILQDPEWNHGYYPKSGGPRVGLAIARMMAHITYLSDASMDRKFGRKAVAAHRKPSPASDVSELSMEGIDPVAPAATFDVRFEVESYLRYQGQSFINRFDANSYLYITRALDQFDLAATHGSLEAAFAEVQAATLVIGFTSDWLFPPDQNRDIALALLRAGKRVSYAELSTDLGHDSFLLESPQLYDLVRGFLN
ncbi:homoserine O-acetyltransferase MetX [Rariglobus hedericola]|uniref:Homoserine O-acetyltransferase n=1 Tax=Rariglobus hedericola TaxID=2597822 RepID=A0A556QJ86_9BACT|nr:homoserine O-acetyltransferase [Rariglobus hedericola]TSJ76714.1 homoserine O-acetyltransferase [Rariglobus hedericola]